MTLRVIGAGFGRTGTLSLKQALETLGFSKCYHMAEVAENPSHVGLWRAAWRGEEPWDALFEGYAAAVDWPTAAFWPKLMRVYPEAKVVLTVRDADAWFASASRTIFKSMREGLASDEGKLRERLVMAREIIVDGTFGGDLVDRANAVAVYEAHVARVHREVPPDRLVVFDPRDGWGPLCAALGVGEPEGPYPRINTSQEFQERWRGGAPTRDMGASKAG